MTDTPRTGPPEKRERRPGQAAHLENTGNSSRADYSPTRRPVEESSPMDGEMPPILNLEGWGERVGIPVVPITGFHLEKLVAAGAAAWIADDYWCCDENELAFALANATQVINADDVDRFNHVAAGLALEGERVLLLDWPEGAPLPLRGGGGA